MRVLVAKHVPDPRRGEPRNVGIIVTDGHRAAARFLGESQPGHIDGRSVTHRLGTSVEVYREWVVYWRDELTQGLDRILDTGRSNFYIVDAAEVWLDVEHNNPDALVTEYFDKLVADPSDGERQDIQQRAEALMTVTGITARPDFQRNLEIVSSEVDPPERFRFPYAIVNGSILVADRVRLTDHMRVDALLWRFQNLEQEVTRVALVADSSATSETVAHAQRLHRRAVIVDMDTPDAAMRLAEAFGSWAH